MFSGRFIRLIPSQFETRVLLKLVLEGKGSIVIWQCACEPSLVFSFMCLLLPMDLP